MKNNMELFFLHTLEKIQIFKTNKAHLPNLLSILIFHVAVKITVVENL